MDLLSGLSIFDKMLEINGKLISQKSQPIEPKNESSDKYCSIYVEYNYLDFADEIDDQYQITIVLTKRAPFSIPIWSIDWIAGESSLDQVCSIDREIPKPLLVADEGHVIKVRFSEILRVYLEEGSIRGKSLKNFLSTLKLQCRFSDGKPVHVEMPDTLKEALFNYYQ